MDLPQNIAFINALWSLIPIFSNLDIVSRCFCSDESLVTAQLAIQLFLVFSSNGNWNDGFHGYRLTIFKRLKVKLNVILDFIL
jgi:hypothetical protein